jgi:hypothetical protein
VEDSFLRLTLNGRVILNRGFFFVIRLFYHPFFTAIYKGGSHRTAPV